MISELNHLKYKVKNGIILKSANTTIKKNKNLSNGLK